MNTDISCLPDEILQNIFSYLSGYDRLKISLVCKHWLKTVDCVRLLQNIFIKWECSFPREMHLSFSRRFVCFRLYDISLTCKSMEFFTNYGTNIKELEFYRCKISTKFVKTYQGNLCENLNALKFDSCFFNIFFSLPFLKTLCLHYVPKLHVSNFGWNKIMPNIKELELCDNKWILSDIIPNFIGRRRKVLVSLLRSDLVENHDISEFLKTGALQLKKLRFNCKDSQIISNIFNGQNYITDIVLDRVIDDNALELICKYLPSLKNVCISRAAINSAVISLFHLKHLRSLKISRCNKIEKETMKTALSTAKLPNLMELMLSNLDLDDEALKFFLKRTPKLRCLEFFHCSNISNETVTVISNHLILIRQLTLSNCDKVTDCGLHSIGNIKGLKTLFLIDCPQITPESLLLFVKFHELRNLGISPVDKMIEKKLKLQNPSLKSIIIM